MKKQLKASDIALMGMMIATLEVAKYALSFLPNVELVTLLIILYTLYFGNKMPYVLAAFVFLEGCWYGFGLWWVMYLYVWPLLAGITYLLRRQRSVWVFSILSGAFGLMFGALCSLVYLFVGGSAAAFTWWVAGIPYDLIHGVSNFILCSILFYPLRGVLEKISN